MSHHRRSPWWIVASCVLLSSACEEDAAGPDPSSGLATEDLIPQVLGPEGSSVSFVEGGPPVPGSGITASVQPLSAPILGGSTFLDITSDAPFDAIIVLGWAVDSLDDSNLPNLNNFAVDSLDNFRVDSLDNFYVIDLNGSFDQASFAVTLPQELDREAFYLLVATRTAGTVNGYRAIRMRPRSDVAAGVVQVSVSWDTPSDVDLHVFEPNGEEIFFGNPLSETGGELDIDSNAACSIDNINQENITWTTTTPPSGTYTVVVRWWSNCNIDDTVYIVTVQTRGETQVFTGLLAGDNDEHVVTSFVF